MVSYISRPVTYARSAQIENTSIHDQTICKGMPRPMRSVFKTLYANSLEDTYECTMLIRTRMIHSFVMCWHSVQKAAAEGVEDESVTLLADKRTILSSFNLRSLLSCISFHLPSLGYLRKLSRR